MFATGFSMNAESIAEPAGESIERFLSSVAEEHGVFVVGGAAIRGRDGKARNKALVFGLQDFIASSLGCAQSGGVCRMVE